MSRADLWTYGNKSIGCGGGAGRVLEWGAGAGSLAWKGCLIAGWRGVLAGRADGYLPLDGESGTNRSLITSHSYAAPVLASTKNHPQVAVWPVFWTGSVMTRL
jgi:hypothetical protein